MKKYKLEGWSWKPEYGKKKIGKTHYLCLFITLIVIAPITSEQPVLSSLNLQRLDIDLCGDFRVLTSESPGDVRWGSRKWNSSPQVHRWLSLTIPVVQLSSGTFPPWGCPAQRDSTHPCQGEVAHWSSVMSFMPKRFLSSHSLDKTSWIHFTVCTS